MGERCVRVRACEFFFVLSGLGLTRSGLNVLRAAGEETPAVTGTRSREVCGCERKRRTSIRRCEYESFCSTDASLQDREHSGAHLGGQDVVQEPVLGGQPLHELGDGGVDALQHLVNLREAGALHRVEGLALQHQRADGGVGALVLRHLQRLVLVRLAPRVQPAPNRNLQGSPRTRNTALVPKRHRRGRLDRVEHALVVRIHH